MTDFRCREDPRKFTKVSMHSPKAPTELRQPFSRHLERFFVAIDPEHVRFGRCLQNCFAMPAQAYRAIDKQSAALCREQLDRLSK